MSWWWMSFCDAERAEGDRFLGALLIEAQDEYDMVTRSHALKLNPGGELMFFKVPGEYEECIDPSITYRLLSRAECEAFERRFNQ
jgi:hypothetical protein